MSKSGIVNVRMVITEDKIISNIDKVQKMINPNNKKKIIQLEEDTYFKDLIESIKSYIIDYPKKNNFPANVYNAAYKLVEYAIEQFEENTRKVESLIKQREENIALADVLNELIEAVDLKSKGYKTKIEDVEDKFSKEIIEALNTVARCKSKTSQRYNDCMKILRAKANNLSSNLHIEIDMERLEDSSKALSFIGIEISDALKLLPAPNAGTEDTEMIDEETDVEDNILVDEPKIVAIAEENKSTNEKKINNETVQLAEETNTNIKEEPIRNVQTVKEFKQSINANFASESTEQEIIPKSESINKVKTDVENIEEDNTATELQQYNEQTTFTAKPSLWQRIKNSKIVKAATYVFRIRIRIELPSNALPEGKGE